MTSRDFGIRDLEDLLDLREVEREERTQALRAISRARREGTSVEEAAGELGVDMGAVRLWAGDALQPSRSGLTFPKPTDRIVRFHPLAVDGSVDLVAAEGSEEFDEAAHIFDVQWRWVEGRASADDLQRLPGTFKGRTVVRDPGELNDLARAGEFSIDELYREIFG